MTLADVVLTGRNKPDSLTIFDNRLPYLYFCPGELCWKGSLIKFGHGNRHILYEGNTLRLTLSGTHYMLSKNEVEQIRKAAFNPKHHASCRIHIHIDKGIDIPLLDRAAEVFNLLRMDDEGVRGSILIYLNKRDREFAVIGDKNAKRTVGLGFWKELTDNMTIYFKNKDFVKGIIEGLESAVKALEEVKPGN
jgi:hypothetical protein